MKNGLNTRQKSFAKHIVAGNNGTKSAILAGYSKRSAQFTASRLLTNHNVCQQIEEIFEQAGLRKSMGAIQGNPGQSMGTVLD